MSARITRPRAPRVPAPSKAMEMVESGNDSENADVVVRPRKRLVTRAVMLQSLSASGSSRAPILLDESDDEQEPRHALNEVSVNVSGNPVRSEEPLSPVHRVDDDGDFDDSDEVADASDDEADAEDLAIEEEEEEIFSCVDDEEDDGDALALADVEPGSTGRHDFPEVKESSNVNVIAFRRRLRLLLEDIKSKGSAQMSVQFGPNALRREDRVMTNGFSMLTTRVDISFLMRMYLSAISLRDQEMLGRDVWRVRDFRALSSEAWREESRQGIYGNTALEDPIVGPQQYVGSAGISILKRVDMHVRISKRKLESLTAKLARSKHYGHICQEGVTSQFHVWAAFDKSVESGYLLLLEALFMVILDTYQDPHVGSYHKFNNKASYDYVRELRSRAGFPSVPWKGLNYAFALYQGFHNRSAKSSSACLNPACHHTTIPWSQSTAEHRAYRRLSQPFDPLGGYLCGSCAKYRIRHGELPDPEWIEKNDIRTEKRHDRVLGLGPRDDVSCDCCTRPENLFSDGGRFRRHHALDKVLCSSCWTFLRNEHRLRTPEEVADFLLTHTSEGLVVAAESENITPCDKCGTTKGRINWRPDEGLHSCHACNHYYKMHGEARSAEDIAGQAARAAGHRECAECGRTEGRISFIKALQAMQCSTCKERMRRRRIQG